MGTIIHVNFGGSPKQDSIDVTRVAASKRKLQDGLIAAAASEHHTELAQEHASEPIKDIDEINRISEYLVSQERYRDNMLFIVGINFGLRVSDLIQLTFGHLIDSDFTFKTSFPILEKKTKKTRKVQKNRYITINDAVMDAVTLYLEYHPSKLDDYLFRSESNNGRSVNKPISRATVDVILKGIASDLGIKSKVATHTLRKTFGYHQMMMSGNSQRKLLILQKMFGHSSATQTLDYIGITMEEIAESYMNLTLGSQQCYQRFNAIAESDATSA